MDLAEQLAAELTALRAKMGKAEATDDFSAAYTRLLHLITATLTAMRQLALEQGQWLYGQAGKQGRWN